MFPHFDEPDPLNMLRLHAAAAVLRFLFIDAEDLSNAASAAMDAGLYSDSLHSLYACGPTPDFSEMTALLGRALAELGSQQPTREQAAWILMRHYVERLVDESCVAGSLLEKIWLLDIEIRDLQEHKPSSIAGAYLDASTFIGILFTYDEPVPGDPVGYSYADLPEWRAKLDAEARQEAFKWLRRHPETIT